MKKISAIISTLVLVLFSAIAFSQASETQSGAQEIWRFTGNTTNVVSLHEDAETIIGDANFVIDLESLQISFNDVNQEYTEAILDYEWDTSKPYRKLLLWSELCYYEINYGKHGPMVIMEFPLLGEVLYRQYYFKKTTNNIKPVMSNGRK